MRLVPVTSAQAEHVAADVPAARPDLAPLVRAGAVLSPALARGLESAGISHVWVEDERVHAGDLLPVEVRHQASMKLQGVLGAIVDRGVLGPADETALDELVAEVLRHLALPSAFPNLVDPAPAAAFDTRHALGTCALGLMLAAHLGNDHGRWATWLGAGRHGGINAGLAHLGRGLLLCDIAKHLRGGSPAAIAEALTALLEPLGPFVLATVAHHDDRADDPAGSPPALARIAAVADGVDARIRAAGPDVLAPQAEALRWAVSEAGSRFDRSVVAALLECLAPHPPGTCVEVPDGRVGLVVEVTAGAPGLCRVAFDDGSVVQHDATVAAAEPVA